jgi:hypothetical protein
MSVRARGRTGLRTLLLAAALSAIGCAAALAQPVEPAQGPKNYRKLVLDTLPTLFPGGGVELGEVRLSPLQETDIRAGADWIACLETDARGKPRLWALFFRGDKLVHWRGALPPDRCEGQSFSVLKPAARKRR